MDQIELEHSHHPKKISDRLKANYEHGTLGDFVLGAVDGTITTFAIVSGVAGAGFTPGVAIVLGVANLIADGFSMAASGYLKARSDVQTLERYRSIEEKHILYAPEGEREEVRQIYENKGFEGEILEQIVETICSDPKRWVNAMLVDEYGLQLSPTDPRRAAVVTLVSFILIGFIPLAPLLFTDVLALNSIFIISATITGITFISIGAFQGWIGQTSKTYTAVETLAVGSAAALLAFGAGKLLGGLV
jgi:VIT1/CCC1 family predicted Fe2+/Mn2+ transporter